MNISSGEYSVKRINYRNKILEVIVVPFLQGTRGYNSFIFVGILLVPYELLKLVETIEVSNIPSLFSQKSNSIALHTK